MMTQEDFSSVSSRTYLSALERGLKSPTLDKIQDLCSVMKVHPVTLMALAYGYVENRDPGEILSTHVLGELEKIRGENH